MSRSSNDECQRDRIGVSLPFRLQTIRKSEGEAAALWRRVHASEMFQNGTWTVMKTQ